MNAAFGRLTATTDPRRGSGVAKLGPLGVRPRCPNASGAEGFSSPQCRRREISPPAATNRKKRHHEDSDTEVAPSRRV